MRMTTPFILLALMFSACGGAGIGEKTSPGGTVDSTSGGQVSDFTLKDVDGNTVSLSNFLGKKVIFLSFWATWCEPCKKEMVQLQELFETHRNNDLQVLCISMDEPETQGDVRPFVKQRGFTFPVLLDTESQATSQFNPRRAAPFSLIIDQSQNIAWTHEGYVPGDEKKIEEAVMRTMGKI